LIDEAEDVSRDKVQASPSRDEQKILRDDQREKAQTDAKNEKQRRRIEQLESKEQRDRRVAQEAERRKKEQAELEKRRAAKDKEDAEKAMLLARQQQEARQKTEQQRQQEALILRNQQEVRAILKDNIVAPAVVTPAAPAPSVPVPVKEEDPEALLLKQAAAQEQEQLEAQRALIRKDFEDGVDRLYNEGVILFKKKMYNEAREDFKQVDGLIKGYKKTAQYLKDTERYLPRSSW
jgi:hypothetical protein